MNAQKWKQLRVLFDEAITHQNDSGDLEQFILDNCGEDPELGEQLRRLLENEKKADDFLVEPVVDIHPPEVTLAAGTLLGGRFLIETMLGAGGMGEVYRARDIRLNRPVAIKVLPARLVQDPGFRRRLEREAQAVAKLSHPNICPIHHFDNDAGRDYLVFEYLEGETLADVLRRGPLRTSECRRIGLQIASALAYAHANRIIHRDLKPSNVMISGGQVKLLDFGLAKRPRPTDSLSRSQTAEGHIVGTASYMSPEQANGEELDARSDIFSFGALMYEMVTGVKAFDGDSFISILAAILRAEPRATTQFVPAVPDALNVLISRCLRKARSERPQTMDEICDGLREIEDRQAPRRAKALWLAALTAAFAVTSIVATAVIWWPRESRLPQRPKTTLAALAVIPFENATKDPTLDYLVDGLSDSLTSVLSQMRSTRVISKVSSLTYKGQKVDPVKAGKELRVGALVTGKLYREGNDLGLDVAITSTANRETLWIHHYKGALSDIFRIQSEAAQAISERIQSDIPRENRSPLHQSQLSPDAYQLYLKGRYALMGNTGKVKLKGSIDTFRRAIEADPSCARCYAGLSDAYTVISGVFMAPREAMPKAKAAAQRAIELDPNGFEGYLSMAMVTAFFDFQPGTAETYFQKALELNPNDAFARTLYATFLSSLGRFDESIRQAEQAADRDPLSSYAEIGVAQAYNFARRTGVSLKMMKKILEFNPNDICAMQTIGAAHFIDKKYVEAAEAYEKVLAHGKDQWTLFGLTASHLLAGNADKAARYEKELFALHEREYVAGCKFAALAALHGEKERAMGLLERAYEEREDCVSYIKIDPAMDPLRDEPRFKGLEKKLGL
ncbi:MAG: protein kinase [Bryobacterales bacterium]|nr:protein kinase [Bryobacterales bacterium]